MARQQHGRALELLPLRRGESSADDVPLPGTDTYARRWSAEGWRARCAIRHPKARRLGAVLGACGVAALLGALLVALLAGSPPVAAPCSVQGPLLAPGHTAPLNYSLHLTLTDEAMLASPPADAPPLLVRAAANVTLSVHSEARCLAFHAAGLVFERLAVQPLPPQGQGPVCLCGPDRGCAVRVCSEALTPTGVDVPGGGMVSLGLGGLVAAAGSLLVLSAEYAVPVRGDGDGLWRSQPFSASGAAASAGEDGGRVLLTTQFEPTGARMVLPSWDEPLFKARFALSVDAPEGVTVLSNTPAVASSPSAMAGMVRHVFAVTPVMPPYLLALAAGRLLGRSSRSQSGANVTVWCAETADRAQQLEVPLAFAAQALAHYEALAGMPQPLTKFDLVAVPGKGGAMENWGLLMFDEARFLFNPATAGAWELWRTADVVCHEMGHQYFGNLVTCASWADLFVNEGLDSFVEYGCVRAVLGLGTNPLLLLRATSPLGQRLGVHEGVHALAMAADAAPTAPPVVPVAGGAASSAQPDFGVITYSKGASLVAMLASMLGPNHTQAALRQYLTAHAYSTASYQVLETALLEHLQPSPNSSGASQFRLEPWLLQPGLPVLAVSQPSDNAVEVAQQRFCAWGALPGDWLASLSSGSEQRPPTDALSCPDACTAPPCAWPLRLPFGSLGASRANVLGSGSSGSPAWLDVTHTRATLQLPEALPGQPGDPPWTLQADGGLGWYRVRYAADHRRRLREAVAALKPPPSEACGIGGTRDAAALLTPLLTAAAAVDDQLSLGLAYAGGVDGGEVVDMLAAALDSPAAADGGCGSYALLLPALGALRALGDRLASNVTCWRLLQAFAVLHLAPHVSRLAPKVAAASGGAGAAGRGAQHANSVPLQEPPQVLFGRLVDSQVLLAAALSGSSQAAEALCERYASLFAQDGALRHIPAAVSGNGTRTGDLDSAAMAAAVAQPRGCNLPADTTGGNVWQQMLELHLSTTDLTLSRRALFAMAYTSDSRCGDATLALALHGALPNGTAVSSGRWAATQDAAEIAAILASSRQRLRAATVGDAAGDDEPNADGALLLDSFLLHQPKASKDAYLSALEALAEVEAGAAGAWWPLVEALLPHRSETAFARVLSRAWSNTVWAEREGAGVCAELSARL